MTPSQEAILAIAYRFEQINGNTVSPEEQAGISRFELEAISAENLISRLISIIQDTKSQNHFRTTAYWALGKAFDHALLPFFVEQLKTELTVGGDSLYQIMIAIDNLGEPIFSKDRSAYSTLELDLNSRDAHAYLDRKSKHDSSR